MSNFNNLCLQTKTMQFKHISFTLYNYISEESGYLHNLNSKGFENDIDDLECLLLQLTDEEKSLIKKGNTDKFEEFARIIEEKNDNKVGVFIMKRYGAVFVVKPKGVAVNIE